MFTVVPTEYHRLIIRSRYTVTYSCNKVNNIHYCFNLRNFVIKSFYCIHYALPLIFRFAAVMDTVKCCRILAFCRGIETSLYFVKETGDYYLLISKGADPAEDYSSIVLSLNEFGEMVSCDEVTLAYMKEHSECILRSRAAQQISEIYS